MSIPKKQIQGPSDEEIVMWNTFCLFFVTPSPFAALDHLHIELSNDHLPWQFCEEMATIACIPLFKHHDILLHAIHLAHRTRVGGPSQSYRGPRYAQYAEHFHFFDKLSRILRQTNDHRPGIIADDIKTIRLIWDWWAGYDENVVELKSSEDYYLAADYYMKKNGVYSREVVLAMKKAETITYWEQRIIQPEIPETPQPKSPTMWGVEGPNTPPSGTLGEPGSEIPDSQIVSDF